MEYCKSCFNYDKKYDEFRQAYNDVGDLKDHFCMFYDAAIPKEIRQDKKQCPFYANKAKMEEGMPE